MMKVYHIVWGLSIGGMENMLVDIVNEQQNCINVTLCIVNDVFNRQLIDRIHKNVKILFFKRKAGGKNIIPFLKLNYILLKKRPHIIHLHNHDMVETLFVRSLLPSKICITIHNTHIKFRNIKGYDKYFSISPAVCTDILKRYNVDSYVVPNGIIFDKIIKSNNSKGAKSFSIVQVGRLLHSMKGQDLLIQAIDKIVNGYNIKDISVTFIGDGPSAKYLKNLAEVLNVSSYCRFLGAKDREEIYASLKEYHLLIQPSYYEGFGLTLVEGIAANIPVLGSDIEGPLYVLDNGKHGYLFEKGNPDDLAVKIVKIMKEYETPEFTEKLLNNHQYAEEKFSLKNTAKNYVYEYKKMLN